MTPPAPKAKASVKPPEPDLVEPDIVALAQVAKTGTAGALGIVALAVDVDGVGHVRRAMMADSIAAWFTAIDLLKHDEHERPAVVRVEPSGMCAVHVENPREQNPVIVDLNLGVITSGEPDTDGSLDVDL